AGQRPCHPAPGRGGAGYLPRPLAVRPVLEGLPMPGGDERYTDRPADDPWDDADTFEPGVRERDIRRRQGDKRLSLADLRMVAIYQKVILVCILVYLLAIPAQFALPQELRPLMLIPVVPV